MYEQRIQGRHMGKYKYGQTAYVNTNQNRTEMMKVVEEHAHADRNHMQTLNRFVVQRKIVGSGRVYRLLACFKNQGDRCHRVDCQARSGPMQQSKKLFRTNAKYFVHVLFKSQATNCLHKEKTSTKF
jgi:hypothetical protein